MAITQPETFHLPRRTPCFTGFEVVLQHLSEALCDHQLVALQGSAGSGKTAVASEYAWRFLPDYQAVFWLNAATHATLLADLSELCRQLALVPVPGEQRLDSLNQALQAWLDQHPRTLLILDNVAGLTSVVEQRSGHMLVLTRASLRNRSVASMKLNRLSVEEGAALLLCQSAPGTKAPTRHSARAGELARALDRLPLALHLASMYIQATESSLVDYLSLYRASAEQLQQLHASKDRATDALAITCALPAIFLHKHQPEEAELLWLCTTLAPDSMPVDFFTRIAQEVLRTSASRLTASVQRLVSFGLLTIQANADAVSMLPLIQETLSGTQPLAQRRLRSEQLLQAFSHLLPDLAGQTLAARLHMALHILHLAQLNAEWTHSAPASAEVLAWAASLFWEQGLLREAEACLRKALVIWERTQDVTDPILSLVRLNLATLNALLQNYPEAEALAQSALLEKSRLLGNTHPDVLLVLLNLANIYTSQEKLPEAIACYQEVLYFGASALDAAHPHLVTALSEQAQLYIRTENFEEAARNYRQVLTLVTSEAVMMDQRALDCLKQLALIYLRQENLPSAEKVLRQLLEQLEQFTNADPSEILPVLQQLALTELGREQWSDAERSYQRLLTLHTRLHGAEHPETLQCLDQLALLSIQQTHLDQAADILQHLLEVREKTLGSRHPETAVSLCRLAEVHLAQQHPLQAEPLWQRALAIALQAPSPDLLAASQILERLALVASSQGRQAEAIALTASARSFSRYIPPEQNLSE